MSGHLNTCDDAEWRIGVRRRLLFAALATALVAAPCANAADRKTPSPSASQSQTVPYRRVFVPDKNVDAWPRGKDKYIPIEAKDFEDAVAAANRTGATNLSSANITSAQYEAALGSDGILRGRGRWNISTLGPSPALLLLPNLTISIHSLRWSELGQDAPKLGMWGNSGGEANQLGLLVPGSGVMEFDWTLPPDSRGSDVQFPWHVPRAMNSTVMLDLPTGFQPNFDGAALIESKPSLRESDKTNARQLWTFVHMPLSNSSIRIAGGPASTAESRSQAVLHEEREYVVRQLGLEMRANWLLEGIGQKQTELSIELSSGLQLKSAKSGGQELTWRSVQGADQGTNKVILTFPSVQNERALNLALVAWQPLKLGERWQLPIMHAEEIRWSTGKLNLEVSPEFEVNRLNAIECGQDYVSLNTTGSSEPETFSFAAFSPNATLELLITRQQADVDVRIGTSLAVVDPDVTAKLVSEWTATRGHAYRLSGELLPGWSIDAVETIPAKAMAEWFIDRSAGHRRIEIRLSDSISSSRRIQVIIMGRLQRLNVAEPITSRTLKMVAWRDAHVSRHLLSYVSSEPFVIETSGDLPIVPNASLDSLGSNLFDGPSDGVSVVDLTAAAENSGLRLALRSGRYSVDENVEINCNESEFTTNYRANIRPKSAPIDRVVIAVAGQLGNEFRWRERGTGFPIVAERVPASEAGQPDVTQSAERWELRFRRPVSKPIEIETETSATLKESANIALLAFPDAVDQTGRLLLRSAANASPIIESPRLVSIPVPTTENELANHKTSNPVRSAFQFDPKSFLAQHDGLQLRVQTGSLSPSALPVVRYVDLESYFLPDGRGIHRAAYDIDVNGAEEFRPPLPETVRVCSVSVDERAVGATRSLTEQIAIPLPSTPNSVNVKVVFESAHAPLTHAAILPPPLRVDDTATLSGRWRVWLPANFSAVSATAGRSGMAGWRGRLFGPVAAFTTDRPFNPFDWNDWRELSLPVVSARSDTPDGTPDRESSDAERNAAASAFWSAVPSIGPIPVVPQSTAASSGGQAMGSEMSGWNSYDQSFIGGDEPAPVSIYCYATITSWAVASLFGGFVIGRLLLRQLSRWVAALCVLGAAALLLPTTFSPIATGLLWGSVLSRFRLPSTASAANASGSNFSRSHFVSATGLLVLLAHVTVATAEPAGGTVDHEPIEKVLIPVNADRLPVGTKYFVSENFFKALFGHPKLSDPSVAGKWLIRDAAYKAQIADPNPQSEYGPGACTLTFAIETSSRMTEIMLPLVLAEASWPTTAMLDGVPVPISWSDHGRSCLIRIKEPGQYSLTLTCLPKVTVTDSRNEIKLSVPRLPSAQLSLQGADELVDLQVANAVLAAPTQDSKASRLGSLVDASQVIVQWTRRGQRNPANQGLNVADLQWLHIHNGSVEFETKYVLEGTGRRPDFIDIRFDRAWTPLNQDSRFINAEPSQSSGNVGVLHLPLPAEDIDRQEVVVRWKLNAAFNVGNLYLPPIALASLPVNQRWLAVSTDPNLDAAIGSGKASSATGKEFLTRWGNTQESEVPQTVFSGFESGSEWQINVRPHDSEPAVRELLHLSAGLRELQVVYRASVAPGGLNRFQFGLSVPAELSVKEVKVNEADRQIPVRWVRDANGILTVFLSDAARSDYRLTLMGSISIRPGVAFGIPRIASAAGGGNLPQLQLYREDDVNLRLQGFPAAAEIKATPPDLAAVQWLARPVGVYRIDDMTIRTGRITVSPQSVTVDGQQLTELIRTDGAWLAELRASLIVSEGMLDAFQVVLPATCPGPYEFESSVPASTSVVNNENSHKIFKIRFKEPVAKGSAFTLRLRGSLALPIESSAFVPSFELPKPFNGPHYICVPNQIDGRPTKWSTSGVKPSNAKLAIHNVENKDTGQFEVTSSNFMVAMQSETKREPNPRIQVADSRICRGEQGGYWVVSRFILSPNGLTQCDVELPTEQEVVSMDLDGRPAVCSAIALKRWRVRLNSSLLPGVLTVVSRLSLSGDSVANNSLMRPKVCVSSEAIPVELSLWTLTQPLTVRGEIKNASPISSCDLSAARFDRMVGIAEAATTAAKELPTQDSRYWLTQWHQLIQTVQSQAEEALAGLPSNALVSQPCREQIERTTARFQKWATQNSQLITRSQSNIAKEDPALYMLAPTSAGDLFTTTCYVTEGHVDRLSLRHGKSTTQVGSAGIIAFLWVAALAAMSASFTLWPSVRDFCLRWPHLVATLAGLFYWAYLWPSFLGLVIVVVSLWLTIRTAWSHGAVRPEASTVLRSTRIV